LPQSFGRNRSLFPVVIEQTCQPSSSRGHRETILAACRCPQPDRRLVAPPWPSAFAAAWLRSLRR